MFWVLLRARLRMLRNTVRSSTPSHRWVIGGLVVAGMLLFSGIGIGCAVFVRLLQSATATGPGLSAPAAALVSHVYQYLFFFLLAGSVPFVASSLFQDADLPLLLTTPVSPTAVVGMKMIEATVSNSAQFFVLGVPVLVGVAWGVHLDALGWLLFAAGLFLLMAITPAITAVILLVVARIVGIRRIRFVVMGVSVVLALAITLLAVAGANRATQSSTMTAGQFKQALSGDLPPAQAMREIRIASHSPEAADPGAPAWLPSTWASEPVLALAYGGRLTRRTASSFGCLAAAWLILLVLSVAAGKPVVTSEEILEQRDLDNVGRGGKGRGGVPYPGMSTAASGMVLKDLRYIGRDTIMVGQIGTTLILFLVPFVLKYAGGTPANADFDMYGNLALLMLGLVAYMVTSIIGLSSVGLEGKGAWIVFQSPMKRRSFLAAKWIVSFFLSWIIVVVLSIVDVIAFRWSGEMWGIAVAVLTCMSFALSGLGVGLSGLFPRFLYDNPAHRASVWAMVLGFVFATLYVALGGSAVVVGYLFVLHGYAEQTVIGICCDLLIFFTFLFGALPVWLAERRLARYQWEL